MVNGVRQRVSAWYWWRLSLRDFVVERYCRIHFTNFRGLTPVGSQKCLRLRTQEKFNTARWPSHVYFICHGTVY